MKVLLYSLCIKPLIITVNASIYVGINNNPTGNITNTTKSVLINSRSINIILIQYIVILNRGDVLLFFIIYSTVTDFAKFLGISTSFPSLTEISNASNCVTTIISKNSTIG